MLGSMGTGLLCQSRSEGGKGVGGLSFLGGGGHHCETMVNLLRLPTNNRGDLITTGTNGSPRRYVTIECFLYILFSS